MLECSQVNDVRLGMVLKVSALLIVFFMFVLFFALLRYLRNLERRCQMLKKVVLLSFAVWHCVVYVASTSHFFLSAATT